MRIAVLFACIVAVTATDGAGAQAVLARQLTIHTAWPAPAGHFQPRARDIPGVATPWPLRQEQDGQGRPIDEQLKICRGC
jgi:hypothetical protein